MKVRKKKNFDAVKMMRDIRDRLSNRYLDNPEIEDEDLQAIRKKYGIKIEERVEP